MRPTYTPSQHHPPQIAAMGLVACKLGGVPRTTHMEWRFTPSTAFSQAQVRTKSVPVAAPSFPPPLPPPLTIVSPPHTGTWSPLFEYAARVAPSPPPAD